MKFAKTIKELEACTGKTFDRLYIVGGGTKDSLLCELTEKYSGKQVVKGASEATAIVNLKIQMYAVKESERNA
jgi:rhamnulokinase